MATCDKPITIENPAFAKDKRAPKYITVPCGKCYPCLTRQKDSWACRMWLHERSARTATWFATITYDDDFTNGELNKEEFKAFLKSVRTKYRGCTYVAIGEYGPTTFRPHYHVIFWNTTDDHAEIIREIEKSWCYRGMVKVELCNGNRIGYLAAHQFNRVICPDGFLKPFRLVSNGIGKDVPEDLKQHIRSRLPPGIRDDNNMLHPLPRYVIDKVIDNERDKKRLSKKKQKLAIKSLEKESRTPRQLWELRKLNEYKLKESLKKRKWL